MNILTFDIEEWFHILDNKSTKTEVDWGQYESRIHKNMDRIFKILEDNDVDATFFCLGWVAKKYPEVIKKIDELGYEIGTHSNLHQLAYEMTQKEYEEDLKQSIYELEDIIGKKIISYRAPGFSIKKDNLWAFESLHKFGIKNDCSIFPTNRAHGGISNFAISEPCILVHNGVSLKEFPINTTNILGKKTIFSGGGYFRLFPYSLIKSKSKQSQYIMTYFHPRDFDKNQPLIDDLSIFRKFKSYYGLNNCEKKLRNWLNDFNFIDLKQADGLIDWSKANIIEIS
ncbi:polysaccharide deacetylase family protein [Galbibacter pacificus]|uniref:Polysaccharide deacetylase family protein n=1 Tax=Galbibacter pacificus TaxID=2996052 RepID=A0ABT6FNE3_9FLAO|nr:polysaccharide deacetylase family protein [Galbibacter pacificus]MDG3581305.1 polysaccharide deacetylase family protein [Galbibacter pacificus]MDG3584783.1 polysaccharide deacetylase family protein [Galbibacter pacificus]